MIRASSARDGGYGRWLLRGSGALDNALARTDGRLSQGRCLLHLPILVQRVGPHLVVVQFPGRGADARSRRSAATSQVVCPPAAVASVREALRRGTA